MPSDVEEWRAVISTAASNAKARKALKCTFKELKDFRAAHMPDHVWPERPSPEVETEQADEHFEARERSRVRQMLLAGMGSERAYLAKLTAEPTLAEVDEAAATLPHDLAKVFAEFVPGTGSRRLAQEYGKLSERNLIYPIGILNHRWGDGYAFTALGRAVQARLKDQS